jgi:hypothetical protein
MSNYRQRSLREDAEKGRFREDIYGSYDDNQQNKNTSDDYNRHQEILKRTMKNNCTLDPPVFSNQPTFSSYSSDYSYSIPENREKIPREPKTLTEILILVILSCIAIFLGTLLLLVLGEIFSGHS